MLSVVVGLVCLRNLSFSTQGVQYTMCNVEHFQHNNKNKKKLSNCNKLNLCLKKLFISFATNLNLKKS